MQSPVVSKYLSSPWHVVRSINFMLQLAPVESYRIFWTHRGTSDQEPLVRLVWRKGHFMVKTRHVYGYYLRCWENLLPGDQIEDSLGRVLLRVPDYQRKKSKGESKQ
jgi:hypothetical protein